MHAVARFIYDFDKDAFAWIRATFGGEFLDGFLVYVSSLYAWTPFFIFLVVLLFTARPARATMNLFFAIGTFVISYQLAALLATIFMQPAPYVVEHVLSGNMLPAFRNEYVYNLPDWTICAIVAVTRFSSLVIRRSGEPFPRWVWLAAPLLAFSRIYAGFAYPMDTITAAFLGMLIGYFMFGFARNFEMVVLGRKPL